MTGIIELVADYVLSILGKKGHAELAQGKRKVAYILMTIFLLVVFGMAAYAIYSMGLIFRDTSGLRIECHVKVPSEYQKTPWNPPPNGEPEPVRYKKSYEAFWWNCIMIKANNLDARCPFTCNGTPAAVAGCVDGESDADRQIAASLNKYSRPEVQQHLSSIASTEEAKNKIYPYFQETPQPEKVK